ncbi:hypothetical protein M8J76_012365 [Diaphorina citri]|nr:hypothetical protein M8J76_012365 [Diaphorina citri]
MQSLNKQTFGQLWNLKENSGPIMGDYSTFKNGLDIIEALTKRLDRLTGFDSELDNILGGRQHDGGLDGVQFNLSELYMTSKSSNNLMDAYQSRLDPFKNAGILFEETDKTQSHKHETGREISVPCTIQESFPTHQKENSFTMLEEVHHKHNLKLSPMEGYTLSTEELRSEYPINPHLDHTTKMTTVNEDFTKNVDKNLAFKDFTTNVDKDLIFNDFTRKVDENLTFKETRTVKKDLTNNFDEALTRNFHRDLTENFNKDFTSSFDKDLTRNSENEFTNNIDKDIGNYLVLRDTCDADISTNQSQSLTELITLAINGTGDPNSFSTIEEVKDIQHIKFSPLEGCSFNSQVTTTEFSPHDYLSLSAAREAMTSSEHTMLPSLQREHTRDVATLEDYNVHREYEDSQNEKYGEWNRDEVAMYNNEPQDSNSFRTIEEVKDIQHIKFSPLEGCSLNSQVTTTEFSPHDYLSLSATRQAVTSSEHAMLPSGPTNSEATKDIVLLANNTMRNESMRDLATLLDEESHSTRSVNLALVPSYGKVHREYEDTLDVDKHRGWNRDEMAVYNPERSEDPNSFSTIEEVKDIQHIKFSPLEGCSFNSQVTTTEFSPRDYLMLHRVKHSGDPGSNPSVDEI